MFEHTMIVVGSTTIDQVVQSQNHSFQLGGVTTYAGLTFQRHGVTTVIVSNVAPQDVALFDRFHQEQIRVCNGDTARTTYFVNYNDGDARWQELPSVASPITFAQIAPLVNSSCLLHLGPLFPDDIASDALQQINALERFVSLDLQGYVRQRVHDTIVPVVSPELVHALRTADIVKASEEELALVLEYEQASLPQLLARYQIQEILVTYGSRGGIVRTCAGEEIQYAAYPVKQMIDPTGAGDVFFAAYLVHHILESASIAQAAEQASALAARHIAGQYITRQQLALPTSLTAGMSEKARSHGIVSQPGHLSQPSHVAASFAVT